MAAPNRSRLPDQRRRRQRVRPRPPQRARPPQRPPPAPPRAPASASAPAEDSAKAVVFAAFRAAAAGDAEALISRFDRPTAAQAQTLREVAQILSAADRLTDAVAERFGADMER